MRSRKRTDRLDVVVEIGNRPAIVCEMLPQMALSLGRVSPQISRELQLMNAILPAGHWAGTPSAFGSSPCKGEREMPSAPVRGSAIIDYIGPVGYPAQFAPVNTGAGVATCSDPTGFGDQ